jgi:heme/copper-type cytochrome/quinol oxidase subunit 2
MTILCICGLIALAVFAAMIYSIATFPASQREGPATYRRSTLAEVLWASIPIVIVISAALPSIGAMHHADEARIDRPRWSADESRIRPAQQGHSTEAKLNLSR